MEDYKYGRSYIPDLLLYVKAPPGFFLSIFSSLTCPKKPVFSKHDLLWWKVPASQLLFLKTEKILALLYGGKGHEERPFCDFGPVPSVYQPQAQALL